MLDGRIDTQGTPEELQSRGLLDVLVHEAQAEEPTVVSAEELAAVVAGDANPDENAGATAKPRKPKKMIEDEARATGRVKFSVYKSYLKASGYITWVIMLIILGLGQLGGVIEKLWMQIWGEASYSLFHKYFYLPTLRLEVPRSSFHPLYTPQMGSACFLWIFSSQILTRRCITSML